MSIKYFIENGILWNVILSNMCALTKNSMHFWNLLKSGKKGGIIPNALINKVKYEY